MTIDMLPDDVLLGIFDAHRILPRRSRLSDCSPWRWDRLVHVCRRWRQLIFTSPLHLSIQLHCTKGIDVDKFLGCWPAFPITVDYTRYEGIDPDDEDNVLAALEHSDRVLHLCLRIRKKQLAKLAAVIQKPFPTLTKLRLSMKMWPPELVLPRGFLGGSAPRLQELDLEDIIIPEFPKFLSSTRDLVTLRLSGILEEISPETMATYLAPLTSLTSLFIRLYRDTLPSERLYLAPVSRTVLPALKFMDLDGDIHYMEDLVARIDCPWLNSLHLYPSGPSVEAGLQLSQMYKFINHSEDPHLAYFDWIDVHVSFEKIRLKASHKHHPSVAIIISLQGESWQLSHIFQVLNQFSPILSNVHHLTVYYSRIPDRNPSDLDWAQVLVAFSALRTVDLYGGHKLLEYIDGETAARLLPNLDLLYIKDLPSVQVSKFCAARQVSGHPVTIANTSTQFYERQKSYT